jgi:hypothetical protein
MPLEQTIAFEAAMIGATAEEAAADDFMKPDDSQQTLFARLIKAGKSLNTITHFDYPAAVLEQATPLFNGAHVYENHTDPDELRRRKGVRNVRDKVGRIMSPRWNATAQAVEGRLQIFNKALYEQYRLGGDAYGLSMEADLLADPNVNARPRRVGQIVKVKSVAIVDLAGAGGSIVAAAEAAYSAAEAARKEQGMPDPITAADIATAVKTAMSEFMATAQAQEAAANQTDWQAEAEAAKTKLARYEALEAARHEGAALNAASKGKLTNLVLELACEAALTDVADYKPETIKAAVKARYDALAADQPAVSNPIRGMGGTAPASTNEAAQQRPTPPQARSDYQLAKQIWSAGLPTQPVVPNGGGTDGR